MARSCDAARGEAGFVTPQLLLAVGMSLVMLATFANVAAQQYAVAAVQAALDEGARAGTLAGAGSGDCARRTRAAVDGLLGGAYRDGVRVSCVRAGGRVTAAARVRFDGWAPLVPDLVQDLRAEGVAEP